MSGKVEFSSQLKMAELDGLGAQIYISFSLAIYLNPLVILNKPVLTTFFRCPQNGSF
jgi:hypothetical protein